MAKKKKTKKQKGKVSKKVAPRSIKHELVVRVAPHEMVPTETDLAEPIRNGKSLTIPKTWLSEKQITRLVEKTPPKYVYQRPGKGGGKWDYVTVSYVQRVLDYAFGFNWDFEIVEHGKEQDHVWVMGKLTVKNPASDRQIVKTQFGRSEVKHKQNSKDMLDYGNDLKAAASDALKKCASMLGIARDIYGKGDYKMESGNEPRNQNTPALPQSTEPQSAPPVEREIYCHGFKRSGCPEGNEITPQVRDYSAKVYGKPLCNGCQQQSKPLQK